MSKQRSKAVEMLLEQIATDANYIGEALLDMEHDQIKLGGANLAVFRTIAEKIGWMAELGLRESTGYYPIKGDANAWLLGPVVSDALKQASTENEKH